VVEERNGTFVGTPLYVPPEMLEQNYSGFYTDLWSLGCIFYEIIIGRPPFHAETGYQVFNRVIEEEPFYPPEMDP
jgi:serine/threonine protein kinase